MSKTAFLSIKILADAKNASQELDETHGKLGKLEAGAQKAAAGLSVASAGVVAMGKQAFDSASALQQSTGAVEAIFKGQGDQIKALADKAHQAVGLSKNSYQELASIMGAQLKNMGVSQTELIGTTDGLIKKGADLAATFGGTTSDAVNALSSLLKGETDPIERYGISIKEANIKAELAAMGLDKLEGEAAKTARTQAIMNLLTQQSADATGAFAREADTAAGQQERAKAAWENAKATLGEALLPVVSDAAQRFAGLAQWIGDHPRLFQAAAVAIISLTGAAHGIIGAVKAWQAAQILLNVAMKANPIGLVVTAVGALTAGFILAYEKVDWFRNGVDKAVRFCVDGFKSVGKGIQWVIDKIKEAWDWVTSFGDKVNPISMLTASAPAPTLKGVPPAAAKLFGTPTPGITAQLRSPFAQVNAFGRLSATVQPVITNNYYITVNDAVDPISTGRYLEKLLRDYQERRGW